MNITTPVERQAKGATGRSPERGGKAFSTFHLRFVICHRLSGLFFDGGPMYGKWKIACVIFRPSVLQTNEIGKTIDWEILDDPHPQACDVRARSRCNLDRSCIRRLRVRAEDKTEYPARRPARVGAKVTGVELHIGLSSTSHSSLRN